MWVPSALVRIRYAFRTTCEQCGTVDLDVDRVDVLVGPAPALGFDCPSCRITRRVEAAPPVAELLHVAGAAVVLEPALVDA